MTCTHTYSLRRRTRTALARRNAPNAVVAEEESKAVSQEGRQGGLADRVGWLAWWGRGLGGMGVLSGVKNVHVLE